MRKFLENIDNAFHHKNLRDDEHLKLALQFENYQGTKVLKKEICDCLDRTCSDLEKLPIKQFLKVHDASPGYPKIFQECEIFINNDKTSLLEVRNIKPVRKIDRLNGELNIERLKELSDDNSAKEMRLAMMQDYWDDFIKKEPNKQIWLSENNFNTLSVSRLLQKLGLYHYYRYKAGAQFIQFIVSTDNGYKPSWVEAELAFYFSAEPLIAEHGYTRDLATGNSGCKEWLSYAKALKLIDVRVLTLEKDMDFSQLTTAFVQTHSSRIMDLRT